MREVTWLYVGVEKRFKPPSEWVHAVVNVEDLYVAWEHNVCTVKSAGEMVQ